MPAPIKPSSEPRIKRTPHDERQAFAHVAASALHCPPAYNPYLDDDPDQPTGAPLVLALGGAILALVCMGLWFGCEYVVGGAVAP